MTRAYLNYPNTHLELHGDPGCRTAGQHSKPEQRQLVVNLDTLAQAVQHVCDPAFRFAAQAGLNDLRLDLDFGNPAFEEAFARYLLFRLGARYTPFRRAPVKWHCHAA
jgi:hypothetical protein